MDRFERKLRDGNLSRRDLFRLSGAGAAVVAGAGLLAACSNSGGSSGAAATTAGNAGGATSAAAGASPASGTKAPSGKPIVVGASMSLTGVQATDGALHITAAQLFVDRLNKQGGLLGRPVQWKFLDDASQPDNTSANYERLISQEHVDLITGPMGTATTSAGMNVAQRYGYVYPNSTGSLTYQYSYKYQFPTWDSGRYPNVNLITDILNMFKDAGIALHKVAFVINQFPGSNYLGLGTSAGDSKDKIGAVDVVKQAGIDVVNITYPQTITDWSPIAAQIRSADPDFICNYGIGLDGSNLLQALKAINYKPKALFALWTAPQPLAALGALGNNTMLHGFFLPTMPQAQTPAVKQIVQQYAARAKAAKRYSVMEAQAASEWMGWELLTQAVKATNSLDNSKMGDWLQQNGFTSELIGKIKFDPSQNNYPPDESIIEQIQNGVWQSVWPPSKRSAKFAYNA